MPVYVHPDTAQLLQITQLIDSGKIKVTVQQTFPLAQAATAFSTIEQGHHPDFSREVLKARKHVTFSTG